MLWADAAAPLTLAVTQNTLRFEYAAPIFTPDFSGRTGALYRTRLDGEWSAWSAESAREFTNLPSGIHRFRVQARDLSGLVGPEVTLAFYLPAPWHRTPAAFALGALLAALLLFGGHRLRLKVLLAHNRALASEVAARTSELERLRQIERDESASARLAEEKARLEVLRYQLNPHFIYNALNSVYALALTQSSAAAAMVLRLADFCRVALTRQDEAGTTLGAELDKLSLYLDIEKVRWGESLHLEFDLAPAARAVAIPPFLLLPLVENALKYGALTSPGRLSLRITAHLAADGTLDLCIANSGTWIEPASNHAAHGTGLGLTNLGERLARTHPGAHTFTTASADGWVTARLQIRPIINA